MPRWRLWITERLSAVRLRAVRPLAVSWRAEDGSSSLELITTGVVLLVPLVYLVLAMAVIQGGAFAIEGGARQAVRVYVQAPNEAEAQIRAERAIRFALADSGLEDAEPTVTVSCSPDPDSCLTRRGIVTIELTLTVPLPLVPPFLSLDVPVGIPLHASATEQVSRFWSST